MERGKTKVKEKKSCPLFYSPIGRDREKKIKSIVERFKFNSNLSIRACVVRSVTCFFAKISQRLHVTWKQRKWIWDPVWALVNPLSHHPWFSAAWLLVTSCGHFGWRYPCQRIQRCLHFVVAAQEVSLVSHAVSPRTEPVTWRQMLFFQCCYPGSSPGFLISPLQSNRAAALRHSVRVKGIKAFGG